MSINVENKFSFYPLPVKLASRIQITTHSVKFDYDNSPRIQWIVSIQGKTTRYVSVLLSNDHGALTYEVYPHDGDVQVIPLAPKGTSCWEALWNAILEAANSQSADNLFCPSFY